MKNRFLLFLLVCFMQIVADSQQNMDDALDKLKKGIWDGAGNMIEGMGTSFGFVPSKYVYSFVVYNDTPFPICVLREDVVSFMGATFDGKIEDNNPPLLLPFNNTGKRFYNKHLLFTVWMLTDALDKSFFNGWDKAIEILAMINPPAAMLDITIGTQVFKDFLETALGVVFGPVIHESLKKYSILNKMIPLQEFNKDDFYYYRAYYDDSGMSSEYLGALATTDQFVAVFHNKAEVYVSMTFIKNDKEYTATLAPGSFSLLQSDSTHKYSIRPATLLDNNKKPSRVLSFKQTINNAHIAQVPIAPEGIATVECDTKTDPKHPKCTPGPSKTYTYQIFNDHGQYVVGMQGLSIGRFKPPVPDNNDVNKPVVRDINPCECHLWVQSAQQFNDAQSKDKTSASTAIDLPEQIWVYYRTKDYQFKQKVTPGSVLDFTLLRPQIAEKQAWLYVVSLATTDDAKAEKFLDRLASGEIGVGATSSQIQDFTISDNLSKILNNPLANQYGIINDKDGSGVNGVVLLADSFLPRGLGTGPYYYTVVPALFMPNQLSMMATSYTMTITGAPDPQKLFVQKAPTWVTAYATKVDQVKSEVTQFIQQYGMSFLFKNPKDPVSNRMFNDKGSIILNLLLEGPLSIKNPPILRQAGTNNYVFGLGSKPTDWPQPTS